MWVRFPTLPELNKTNMEIKTTKFDVTADNIGYYLGLPVDIEIDYWTERSDERVLAWYLEVYVSKGGLPSIQTHFQYINVTIHWSVDMYDLSYDQIARLKMMHEVTESRNKLEGFIMVYTIREKDKNWKVDFNIDVINGNGYSAHLDFLENKIEII